MDRIVQNAERIRRIQHMEAMFDRLRLEKDPALLKELTDYYESGQWLLDYEADERGELPPELKRGVLSQDGIWNLLAAMKESGKAL